MAKGKEERKVSAVTNKIQDDVSIFYTDLMPLLVSSSSFDSLLLRK